MKKENKKVEDKNKYHEKVNGDGSCPYCGGHSDGCGGCDGTGYNVSD